MLKRYINYLLFHMTTKKKTLVIIGGILVLLIIIGSGKGDSTPSSSNDQNNQTTEQTKAEPINLTFSGKGNKDTESFTLHDGSAKITAKTTGGSVGTYSSITLEKDGTNSLFNGLTGNDLSISTKASEDGNGESTIRGIKEGKYYVHVISGVEWSVTVTQQ